MGPCILGRVPLVPELILFNPEGERRGRWRRIGKPTTASPLRIVR
jgi:hypothetical protein